MKQPLRFMTIPKSFWDNESLSIVAKWVAITIDSYVDNPWGVAMSVRTIHSLTNIPTQDVKNALQELFNKGALEVNINEGEKKFRPLLYESEYSLSKKDKLNVEGEKPSPANSIDYDDVQAKWSEICHTLPQIQRFTPQRKRKLKAAINQSGLTIPDLYKCFRIIASTAFLNGSGEFAAHFDWVVKKSENLPEIYEGFYARSPREKRNNEAIMKGEELERKRVITDDFYR